MIFRQLFRIVSLLAALLVLMVGLSARSGGLSTGSNATTQFDDFFDASLEWPMFRHDTRRSAHQPNASALSDPSSVATLHPSTAPGWPFSPPGARGFRASPIIFKDRVYIGNGNGRFYALDAKTGELKWQFPPASEPPLTSKFTCNPSSYGIASSAVATTISPRPGISTDVVIFGAPDQSIPSDPRSEEDKTDPGLGSGRLFALNAETGAVFWKSPVIAHLTGLTWGSTTELHEQIGYSSPLVFNGRVYVGVANHCDNPIQQGKVIAVRLNTGKIEGFGFSATNTLGGGVWSSVAGSSGALYVTTGNVKRGDPEPAVNYGLSLLQLDANTGSVIWQHQPVPFELDGDPDWAATPTVIQASCGTLIASTQKDGWTYAINAGVGTPGPPSVHWQFPPTGFPFTPADGTTHGDTRYLRPGAAWENVYFTITGGVGVITDVTLGYKQLHALNTCAPETNRIRWLLDVPGTSADCIYCLGPPTVSRGIIFIGTDTGQLVVIADSSILPNGMRCEYPDVRIEDCENNRFKPVPVPKKLAQILLDGAGPIRTEPALAKGRVYVATDAGKLFMLEP